MTCLRCRHATVKRFGYYGRKRIQRYRCYTCKATFSEPKPKPLGEHRIDLERIAKVISLMMEGVSIRAISRLTGIHKTTILSLLNTVGRKCWKFSDQRIRDIRPKRVQADELWTFVHTKEGHLDESSPKQWGDAYVWMALDSVTKLVISHYVGKRTGEDAMEFVKDFSERVRGRFQVTSDGFAAYVDAFEQYFGNDIDYAQLVKIYGKPKYAGPEWNGRETSYQDGPNPSQRKTDLTIYFDKPR